MESTNNIKNKVIVITGASSGIGEATAKHLASKGGSIVLAARRADRLKQITEDIQKEGGEAIYIETDVRKLSDLQSLIDTAVDAYGTLDVMINNAAYMAAAPIKDTMVDDWNQMIDINIKGVLNGIATALPIFQKQGFGHFINIASVAGLKVFSSGGTVYSSTKFAVRAISEGLRQEVGGDIRTTTINPGVVETELINGTTHEETSQMLAEFYKMAIQPEQIAETIAFAIQMIDTVDLNELVVRPVLQEF